MGFQSGKHFYNGKKAFITGHTGFIGSWLTEWLTMLNADVCGYALAPPSTPNIYETLNLAPSIIDIREDIRNSEMLHKAIYDFQPELVFHLAAQPIVLDSYYNPVETFDTNVTGTANLLNELRKVESVKTIIVVTSDKTYRNNEWVYPYRENDPLGGKDPYSASKSCQDIVVDSFRDTYFSESGVGISTVRVGNVIGGGDWGNHRIVPDIVRGIVNNETIMIRNPESTRPWQHVLEPILGMIILAEKMHKDLKLSGPWNFGPNNESAVTVGNLTEKFISIWGAGRYEISQKSVPKEASMLQLDSSKSRRLLHWHPKFDFETSLQKTVEWYKKYYEKKSGVEALTVAQIRAFSSGEYFVF